VKHYKFILSGGGTGGHIYPALAIGEKILERFPGSDLLFVGAIGRMEMKKIPDEGYKIKGIWISGFYRDNFTKNMLLPLKLLVSFIQSFIINLIYRPSAVIGTGGYVSGPMLFCASIMNIPTIIQEQNSFAGITNKLLSKRVNLISVAYDKMEKFFPKQKIRLTGNPIRKSIIDSIQDKKIVFDFFSLDSNKKTIAILGGSLGAEKINELITSIIPFIESNEIQIIWQCGEIYYERYNYLKNRSFIRLYPFIQNMNFLYKAADLIISRAGAGTISELAIVGKPCILIPSPNVADNHQFYNANYLKEIGAAEVFNEGDPFSEIELIIKNILESKQKQFNMHRALLKMAKPKATDIIVDEIYKLIRLHD